jgi:hypothetical protein
MQIRKFDFVANLNSPPLGATGVGSASNATRPGAEGRRQASPSSPAGEELSGLVRQLQALPEVRPSELSRAREAVASGAYLTRRAAEETAAILLGKDA